MFPANVCASGIMQHFVPRSWERQWNWYEGADNNKEKNCTTMCMWQSEKLQGEYYEDTQIESQKLKADF